MLWAFVSLWFIALLLFFSLLAIAFSLLPNIKING